MYAPSSKAKQREAVAFLNAQLFETPAWLLDESILNKISSPSGGDPVGTIQTGVLSSLLSASRMNTLLQSANRFGDTKVYTVEDLLADTHKGVFKELTSHQPITAWRRNLQKTYVESLITILNPAPAAFGNSWRPGLLLRAEYEEHRSSFYRQGRTHRSQESTFVLYSADNRQA